MALTLRARCFQVAHIVCTGFHSAQITCTELSLCSHCVYWPLAVVTLVNWDFLLLTRHWAFSTVFALHVGYWVFTVLIVCSLGFGGANMCTRILLCSNSVHNALIECTGLLQGSHCVHWAFTVLTLRALKVLTLPALGFCGSHTRCRGAV